MADYFVTRIDLGGAGGFFIRRRPDGRHQVFADMSMSESDIDAEVRAALVKTTDRDNVDPPRPEPPAPRVSPDLTARRTALLREAQRHSGSNTAPLFDPHFVAHADESAILEAIVTAAITETDADLCDLQLYDPQTGLLEIRRQHGFDTAFVDNFRFVRPDDPTACAAALMARQPVRVNDVTRHPIFVGQSSLEAMLDVESRALISYPLLGEQRQMLGVLSFHYHRRGAWRGPHNLVALTAAMALWGR